MSSQKKHANFIADRKLKETNKWQGDCAGSYAKLSSTTCLQYRLLQCAKSKFYMNADNSSVHRNDPTASTATESSSRFKLVFLQKILLELFTERLRPNKKQNPVSIPNQGP